MADPTSPADEPLKPYTKYVCSNGVGYGHSTHWTGAYKLPQPRDGWCPCGERMVEEVDDGQRWRVSFDLNMGSGWHRVMRETASERSARSQYEGLLEQAATGEPVRDPKLERATFGWAVA